MVYSVVKLPPGSLDFFSKKVLSGLSWLKETGYIYTITLKQLIMSESLGKKDFGKVGLLAIVFVEELNRAHGLKPSHARLALEKAMSSDLLKLSRREIEEMAVKGKVYSWGYYVQFTNKYIKERELFKIPFYKNLDGLILSNLELIREVEANDNIESFFFIGSFLTKADAIERMETSNLRHPGVNLLDLKHIKYTAEN